VLEVVASSPGKSGVLRLEAKADVANIEDNNK